MATTRSSARARSDREAARDADFAGRAWRLDGNDHTCCGRSARIISDAAMTMEVTKVAFQDLLCRAIKADPVTLGTLSWECFQTLFLKVNSTLEKNVESLMGIDVLWMIAFSVTSEIVAQEASSLLLRLYGSAKKQDFLERVCNFKKDQRSVRRSLTLLSKFVSNGKFASHGAMGVGLPLTLNVLGKEVRSKPAPKSWSHVSMVAQRKVHVTVARFALQVHTNMTLGRLMELLAERLSHPQDKLMIA